MMQAVVDDATMNIDKCFRNLSFFQAARWRIIPNRVVVAAVIVGGMKGCFGCGRQGSFESSFDILKPTFFSDSEVAMSSVLSTWSFNTPLILDSVMAAMTLLGHVLEFSCHSVGDQLLGFFKMVSVMMVMVTNA